MLQKSITYQTISTKIKNSLSFIIIGKNQSLKDEYQIWKKIFWKLFISCPQADISLLGHGLPWRVQHSGRHVIALLVKFWRVLMYYIWKSEHLSHFYAFLGPWTPNKFSPEEYSTLEDTPLHCLSNSDAFWCITCENRNIYHIFMPFLRVFHVVLCVFTRLVNFSWPATHWGAMGCNMSKDKGALTVSCLSIEVSSGLHKHIDTCTTAHHAWAWAQKSPNLPQPKNILKRITYLVFKAIVMLECMCNRYACPP